jgi:hypothetical protein
MFRLGVCRRAAVSGWAAVGLVVGFSLAVGAARAGDLGCAGGVGPARALAFDGTAVLDMSCSLRPVELKPRQFDYSADGFYAHVLAPPGELAPLQTGVGWRTAVAQFFGGLAAKFETGLKQIIPAQGPPITTTTVRTELVQPLGYGLDLAAAANYARSTDTDTLYSLSARWRPLHLDGQPTAALNFSIERSAGIEAADSLRHTAGLTLGTGIAGGRFDAGVTLAGASDRMSPIRPSLGTLIGFKRSF